MADHPVNGCLVLLVRKVWSDGKRCFLKGILIRSDSFPYQSFHFFNRLLRFHGLPVGSYIHDLFLCIFDQKNIIKHQHGIRHVHTVFVPGLHPFFFSAVFIRKVADGSRSQGKLCLIFPAVFFQIVPHIRFKAGLIFHPVDGKGFSFYQLQIGLQSKDRIPSQFIFQGRIQKSDIFFFIKISTFKNLSKRYVWFKRSDQLHVFPSIPLRSLQNFPEAHARIH